MIAARCAPANAAPSAELAALKRQIGAALARLRRADEAACKAFDAYAATSRAYARALLSLQA